MKTISCHRSACCRHPACLLRLGRLQLQHAATAFSAALSGFALVRLSIDRSPSASRSDDATEERTGCTGDDAPAEHPDDAFGERLGHDRELMGCASSRKFRRQRVATLGRPISSTRWPLRVALIRSIFCSLASALHACFGCNDSVQPPLWYRAGWRHCCGPLCLRSSSIRTSRSIGRNALYSGLSKMTCGSMMNGPCFVICRPARRANRCRGQAER